jgi:hypothetical protein
MEDPTLIIDTLLQPFDGEIGLDYNKYKNHVCRVFLNCLLLDNDKNNVEKYAIAAVFHDIGIWTDHTIDYLDPSIEQAEIYLTESGKQEWVEEISEMISWHHKMSPYQGEYAQTVEVFRKADWMDVSLGLLSFGVDKKQLKQNRQKLPNLGFHLFLIKGVSKYGFKHPFNPLPMFKK